MAIEQTRPEWRNLAGESYTFYCPGCKNHHIYYVTRSTARGGPTWEFNGDMEKPTFTPSLLYDAGVLGPNSPRCHLYLKDGMLEFLSDSTHELAGKTAPV